MRGRFGTIFLGTLLALTTITGGSLASSWHDYRHGSADVAQHTHSKATLHCACQAELRIEPGCLVCRPQSSNRWHQPSIATQTVAIEKDAPLPQGRRHHGGGVRHNADLARAPPISSAV